MLRSLTLALGAVILWTAPVLAAPVDTAPVAEWKARPVVDKNSKAFSYCAVENRYDNGLALLFARNKAGEMNIAIGFPEDRLQTERHYSAKISVDGKFERSVESFAPSARILVIPTGANQDLHNALQRGSRLLIEGSADAVAFSLKGTGKALDLLRACVEQASGTLGQAKPKVPIPTALEAILTEARLGTIQIIDLPGDAAARPMDYAWSVGKVFGGVKETPMQPDQQFGELIKGYVETLRPRCPGQFNAEIGATETGTSFTAARGSISCVLEKSETIAPLLFYAGHGTFTVFFHEADRQSAAEAIKARDSIAEVIRRLAEPAAAAAPTQPEAAQGKKPVSLAKPQPEKKASR